MCLFPTPLQNEIFSIYSTLPSSTVLQTHKYTHTHPMEREGKRDRLLQQRSLYNFTTFNVILTWALRNAHWEFILEANVYHLSFGYVFRIFGEEVERQNEGERERYRWQRISSNFPNVFPIPLVFRSYFNSFNPLLIPSFLTWSFSLSFFFLTISSICIHCKWANTTWEIDTYVYIDVYENKQFFWHLIDLLKPRSLNVNCFQCTIVCVCVWVFFSSLVSIIWLWNFNIGITAQSFAHGTHLTLQHFMQMTFTLWKWPLFSISKRYSMNSHTKLVKDIVSKCLY